MGKSNAIMFVSCQQYNDAFYIFYIVHIKAITVVNVLRHKLHAV